jgi:nicotinamide mononucleotide (NMN) deamidase PncC
MAEGVLRHLSVQANVAVANTGIAGPGPGARDRVGNAMLRMVTIRRGRRATVCETVIFDSHRY